MAKAIRKVFTHYAQVDIGRRKPSVKVFPSLRGGKGTLSRRTAEVCSYPTVFRRLETSPPEDGDCMAENLGNWILYDITSLPCGRAQPTWEEA